MDVGCAREVWMEVCIGRAEAWMGCGHVGRASQLRCTPVVSGENEGDRII